jgi:hypothetical protein
MSKIKDKPLFIAIPVGVVFRCQFCDPAVCRTKSRRYSVSWDMARRDSR